MGKLISNSDDIVWIEGNGGDVFGVVSSSEILDSVGLRFELRDSFSVLEEYGFEFEQDWENEATYIELDDSYRLVFSENAVSIVQK